MPFRDEASRLGRNAGAAQLAFRSPQWTDKNPWPGSVFPKRGGFGKTVRPRGARRKAGTAL